MSIRARYNMRAEVYEQTQQQDESGQITRAFDYSSPVLDIECMVRGVTGGGIRVVGSTERWDDLYENVGWARLYTTVELTKRQRIGRVRHVNRWNEEQAWVENGEYIVFDVLGVTPIHDPFGTLVEFEVLLQRVQE